MTKLRSALPALGLLGCVSDFSPDPAKGNQNVSPDADAAIGLPTREPTTGLGGGAGSTDASLPSGTGSTRSPGEASTASGSAGCDLSGRWIVTEHATSVAAGAKQVSLLWLYMELTQQGSDLTVSRSVLCGGSTKSPPGELVSVNMDDSPSWPAYQAKANYDGRKGAAVPSSSGCDVRFEQGVLVRGATVSAYRDPSVALPPAEQKAEGSTPGWEDWDADGNPGITMNVTTLGVKLYTSFRTVATASGTIAAGASSFVLDRYDWTQKRLVYGTNADPVTAQLVTAEATRSPAAGDNFVELARLAADQATGSDDALCAEIRKLKDSLNPSANEKW